MCCPKKLSLSKITNTPIRRTAVTLTSPYIGINWDSAKGNEVTAVKVKNGVQYEEYTN
jgi:hypothetical protein